MSDRTWSITLGFFLMIFSSASAVADEFFLQEQRVEAPEMGQLACYLLTSGQNQFRFVPPTGWRVASDSEQHRVVMHSPDSKASICLAISTSKPGPKSSDSLDALREALRHRFAGAVIAEEFSCYSNNQPGHAFDLQWSSAGVPMASRIACFSAPNGSLEFTLCTTPTRFRDFQPALGRLLTSFQALSPGQR
jgi:hypothetical protein